MSCTNRFTCYTYGKLYNLITNYRKRTIANNTIVHPENDGSVCIQYYATDILRYYPDDSVILNTNSWQTTSTRERINGFLTGDTRGAVAVKDGVWVYHYKGEVYEYKDGMRIDRDGKPNTSLAIIRVMEKYTGVEFSTLEDVAKYISELDIGTLQMYWKRSEFRGIIATYCNPRFLPLTMGTRLGKSQEWRNTVEERLRAA